TWPIAAQAQQAAKPVIGFLNSGTPETYLQMLQPFHERLREASFVEGQNVAVEYRWARDEYDQVPALAADLVQRRVRHRRRPTLRTAGQERHGNHPDFFMATFDPIRMGLVPRLSRPGGNLTGSTVLATDLPAKRFGLSHHRAPTDQPKSPTLRSST